MGLLAAVSALGAACSGGPDEGPRSPTTTTTVRRTAPATTDPAIRIVLGAGRLTVGGNALVFEAPASQVSSYLERALGDPEDESEQDCGPGRLEVLAWPSLQVFLLDGRLAGWTVDDDTYSTDLGLAVGSSRAELQSTYPMVAFVDSTLGDEFLVEATADAAAGLSGLVEGDRVVALWSGATCIAR